MKSALFVDFDNVFSQLRQLQPDAAERFARLPALLHGHDPALAVALARRHTQAVDAVERADIGDSALRELVQAAA